jgi:hypothetical protein
MVLPSGVAVHARDRDGAGGADDPGLAGAGGSAGADWRGAARAGLTAACALALALAGASQADTVRVATWSAGLTRAGPGLLLRDIRAGEGQVEAAVAVIAAAAPDILLLTGFDHDLDGVALDAFAARLAAAGLDYQHRFAPAGNRGLPTGVDLDGDGQVDGPGDAQGWGRFAGAGAMAILSRLPIAPGARDFSGFLWRDLPGSAAGQVLPPAALAVQRLHASGAWELPVVLPGGAVLRVLAFHATPPVFDGAEARNLRRNADEVAFWRLLLDGALPHAPPVPPFVLAGNANLDPADGAGERGAIVALLAHPAVQDPAPAGTGGADAAAAQGGVNRTHAGDPALDTADFRDADGPGNLRVDYVLPSADLAVTGAGVLWPPPGDPLAAAVEAAGRHRLVWLDIALPPPALPP